MRKIVSIRLFMCAALFALGGCALTGGPGRDAARWTPLRELRQKSHPPYLSGITHAGGDLFYAVADREGKLHPLRIEVSDKGRPRAPRFGTPVALAGARDLEGVAWDPLHRTVWASDEAGVTIREFNPESGERRGELVLPAIFRKCRPNLSLEALAISPDGLELWTANEEALECDGPVADSSRGSRARLCRFRRPDAAGDWRQDGMWVYETDPMAGDSWGSHRASGLSGLMFAPDGSLYALERELSRQLLPAFRARIYRIDVTDAEDVSCVASLKDRPVRPVRKSLAFDRSTGIAMYEGCCFGPPVDGGRLVVLCADGDGTLAHGILYLVAP